MNDFERPLNKRGRKNARQIGKWLTDDSGMPATIICSPAARARQTVELVLQQSAGEKPDDVVFDESLYLASRDTLLGVIGRYKNELQSLMLVAHNPGLEQLVYCLANKTSRRRIAGKSLTTANLAILEFLDSDFDQYRGRGNLVSFIKPKELTEH